MTYNFAGTLPVPVQLSWDSYARLVGSVIAPSSTGHSLLLQDPQQSHGGCGQELGACTAAVAAAALATNDHGSPEGPSSIGEQGASCSEAAARPSWQCLAEAGLALAPVDMVLTAAASAPPGTNRSCGSYSEFLPRCRSTIKHLHLLLSQQRIVLRVSGTANIPAEQQLEMTDELLRATRPAKQRGSRATGTGTTAAGHAAAAQQPGHFCWALVAVWLSPRCLFDPQAAVSSTTFLQQQQQAAQGAHTSDNSLHSDHPGQQLEQQLKAWSLPDDQLEFPPDTAAAAINCLVQMLRSQDLLLHHYTQLAAQLHTPRASQAGAAAHSTADPGSSSASETDYDMDPCHAAQQQCPQLLHGHEHTCEPCGGASASSSQLADQLKLLHCADTAAAAAGDVRQCMFDLVDSQPWQLEADDPSGLACQLYRYQRRALAWMLWREQQQQGQHAKGPGRKPSAADLNRAAGGVLGGQLLNPLWTKVTLTLPFFCPQPGTAPDMRGAPAAAAAATAGNGSSPMDCTERQQQQQQQQLVLYHAPSHGLISMQRPAAYKGPAGGMLCDEMGIGKTVEVFALILAHPPPSSALGKRGAAARTSNAGQSTAQAPADGDPAGDADDSDGADHPLFERASEAAAKRRRRDLDGGSSGCEGGSSSGQAAQAATAGGNGVVLGPSAAAAAADGSASTAYQHEGGWPAAGKWAGATLVVTPPAILQQWVVEAQKRTKGLRVQVYDGLKWQRAQADAAARKEAGRHGKAARAAADAMAAWQYLVDGPPDAPVFDATAEAAAAVAQLLEADVVLTTYDVLQQEVYYSGGNSDRLSSLRHKKRYQVPQSPLLQVDWWRLAFDEAQQVGPLSNTAVMAGYLQARHRWVVTGTPIGSGGLADIGNLLRLINASPFHRSHVFSAAISRPFYASVEAAAATLAAAQGPAANAHPHAHASDSDDESLHGMDDSAGGCEFPDYGQLQQQTAAAAAAAAAEGVAVYPDGAATAAVLQKILAPRYRSAERDGVRRLLALLQPLMWRTSKAVADLDHPLPPRHLQHAYLRFSPAERSFYDHIIDKTATAKLALEQQQQQQQQQQSQQPALQPSVEGVAGPDAAAAAAAAADGVVAVDDAASGGGKAVALRRGRGRGKKAKGPQDLQELAADQVAQLRRACVHPQLTSYWKELSNELQLQRGGALSISEILGRMRDAAQLKLQGTERELCTLLNAHASILMSQADAAAASGGQSGKRKGGKKRRRGSAAAAKTGSSRPAGEVDLTASQQEGGPAAAEGADGNADEAAADGDERRGRQLRQRPQKRARFADDADAAADGSGGAEGASAAAAAAGAAGGPGSSTHGGDEGGVQLEESPEELRATALKLLEDSWAVAQHGIRAILPGSTQQDLEEPLGDISGGDTTWKAWKLVELHTAQLAVTLATSRQQSAQAAHWQAILSRKQVELLETPLLEEAKARTRVDKHARKVQDLEQQLLMAWSEAAAAGVPLKEMTGVADGAVWLSMLAEQLTAAKALEQDNRQQVMQDNGPVVLTTVLATQHVPQQLEVLEASAATDRALLEGVVGAHYTQQLVAQLHQLEVTLHATAMVGTTPHAALQQAQAGPSTAAAAAAAAAGSSGSGRGHKRKVRFADTDEYDPAEDSGAELEAGDVIGMADDVTLVNAAASSHRQPPASQQQLQQSAKLLNTAVNNWADNSSFKQQRQQQQQQRPDALLADPAAAAHAATYQFLDCLPERRLLWRVVCKGTIGPVTAAQQMHRQEQGLPQAASSSAAAAPPAPSAVAAALGGLSTIYAAHAFNNSSTAPATAVISPDEDTVLQAVPSPADAAAAALAGLQSYQARLCSSKGASLMRQFSRQVQKRHAGYVRSVSAAASHADDAASTAAANAAEAAAVAAGAVAEGGERAAAAVAAAQEAAAVASKHVNVPMVLQELPSAAVATAAESARLRLELCRAHKELHTSELRLEVVLHNKQVMQDEGAAAAAGQAPQALAVADKSPAELARLATELIKKCDELARHKRFLDNQAMESRTFAEAAKRKKAAAAAAAASAGDAEVADGEEGDVECAVCRSPMSEELQVFGCGHYYCDDCAQQALSAPKPTCPYCRKAISRNGVFRVSLGGAGGQHDPEVDPPEGEAVKAIKVTGSWMTKIEALLRRLLMMRANDPSAKALVFSKYPDALALISRALNVVQLEHVSLGVSSGRQAVREAVKKFTENPDVCVFLLSLRAGSAGLTLTSATRVYLLEPSTDPAIEQQAVARVHRIGQEKEVVITRLLVADTIEEEVLAASEAKQQLLLEKEAEHSRHLHQLHAHGAEHGHHHGHRQHSSGKSSAGGSGSARKPRRRSLARRPQHQQAQAGDDLGQVPPLQPLAGSPVAPHSAAAAAAAAAGEDSGGLTGFMQQQRLLRAPRQHSSSGGSGGADGPAAAAAEVRLTGTAAPPLSREAVLKGEAVGLLQSLMKHHHKDG